MRCAKSGIQSFDAPVLDLLTHVFHPGAMKPQALTWCSLANVCSLKSFTLSCGQPPSTALHPPFLKVFNHATSSTFCARLSWSPQIWSHDISIDPFPPHIEILPRSQKQWSPDWESVCFVCFKESSQRFLIPCNHQVGPLFVARLPRIVPFVLTIFVRWDWTYIHTAASYTVPSGRTPTLGH